MRSRLMLLVGAAVLISACDEDTSAPGNQTRVNVAMSAQSSVATSGTTNPINANGDLVLTGTNGVLTITDVKLVVSEFELKRDNDDDCEQLTGSARCKKFESAPFLVDLPLNGGEVVVATDRVPAGTYTKMEFEIEDLDDDNDDSDGNRQVIQQLRSQLRAAYPGISDEASVVVTGTFTPTVGQARPFTVFLDADIEVEMDLNPPLVITDGGANRTVKLSIDPALWFRSNGQVIDLSGLNGRVLEFEVEVENGFTRIEWDD